jgi:protein-S-isoprenylcysteine O-methyltransferase Ste14
MTIKGLDQLRKHVPDFNSPIGVLRILFIPMLLILLVTALLTSEYLSSTAWLLGGEILFGGLGFFLLYLFIQYRNDFKARFGPLAYSKAVRWFGFPGVAIIAAVVAHIRSIPGPEIPHYGWYVVLPGLGWALIAVGLLLFLRTLHTFGLDYLIMLYVYFPEESHLVDHKIYTILRHPAYAAAQCLTFGLALLNGNWLALVCALIFALGLWGWVRLVEEKELIERFGPSYNEYRRRVPAFWPRLRDLKGFFEILIVGEQHDRL